MQPKIHSTINPPKEKNNKIDNSYIFMNKAYISMKQ